MQRLSERLVMGVVLSGICAGTVFPLTAQIVQAPTAEEIVARMNARDRQRQTALASYGSERTYRMNYKGPMGDRTAEVVARMDFSAPDQKHFTVLSESGSAVFCHKVLRRMMDGEQEGALQANHLKAMLSAENYHLKLVGEDQIDGVKTWVLEVSPKVNNRFNYKGKVWIGEDDHAVVRIVGSPARNPSWITSTATFDYRYGRQGEFWLPRKDVIVSHVRLGGEVTLTVDYGKYAIVPSQPSVTLGAMKTGDAPVTVAKASLPQ